MDGETTIQGDGGSPVPIKVGLSGRASHPEVHLWDEKGTYTQADLWRRLTVGQVLPGNETSNTGQGTVGVEIGRAYLFRNAERWLSQSGWIDTFDLQSGARSGGANPSNTQTGGPLDIGIVGAGKYVTRDLYVNYSQGLTGQAEQRIGAEYRVTRHLLLSGERTHRNSTVNAPGGEEYNLDLKVRLEY